MAVVAFVHASPANHVAMTASDSAGIFQLDVAAGSYELCTYGAAPETITTQWQMNCAGKCTFVDIGDALVRADWAANLSGGWWDAGDHCPH